MWLDQADAQDPDLVGAKAARLARARSFGLPVSDGFVVPAAASQAAISQGETQLRTPRHSGAARTAVFNHPPAPLLAELPNAAAALGETVVVRSSSRVESEGIWAGAFSSYLDLRPEEAATGVIGCWASVFNPGALRRAQAVGISPSAIGMAVLIQARLPTAWGGVATLEDTGQIKIAGMKGHHAPLVAGWENGHLAVVSGDDGIRAPPDSPFRPQLLVKVAHLVRRAGRLTGDHHIEWAMAEDGEVYLLQAQPGPSQRPASVRPKPPAPLPGAAPELGEVVCMMLRYPGPVGERVIWPWAVGLPRLPSRRGGLTPQDPTTLWREIRQGAALLKSQRWGDRAESQAFERSFGDLRKGDESAILELLSHPGNVDPGLVGTHLQKLEELAEALTRAGVIPGRSWMWHLDLQAPGRPLSAPQGSVSRRIGIGKWDPLIFRVIVSGGTTLEGHPAAGGWGAGRLRFIKGASDAASFSPRDVIATDLPIGNLAPLLWNAAGLITQGGSPGAHLFEVAGWLGVPAVCGVDLGNWMKGDGEQSAREGLAVAVDGDRGRITRLP